MTHPGGSYIEGGGPLPRGTCPTCGKWVALRKHGQLREHRREGRELCPASGKTIRQVEQLIAREVDGLRRMSR